MGDWRTAFCETNGIRMHYTRTGGRKPPLLLLHGLLANGLCWTAVAQALEDQYDVILPDLRGHGQTSGPGEGYRYEDQARDVEGLMEGLGITAVLVMGHSMGGLLAAVVASRNPGLVQGLVLADPTFLDPRRQLEVRDSGVADQHRKALARPLEDLMDEMRLRHPHRSQAILRALAQARLETRMAALDVLTPPYPDYRELVASLPGPVLLVTADAGVVSPEQVSELQRLHPNLQGVRIRNAGHGLFYDRPEEFSARVKPFLHSVL